MPPFFYTVPESCNTGFLKLVVSTRPIHSTAGTWPCPCRLEDEGPSTLDRGETWGTLTIPMIQRRSPASTFSSNIVSSAPPLTFAHLVHGFFLDHYVISGFQFYHTWHISEPELDTISPYLSNSLYALPFSFALHLFIVVDNFRSPICFNSLVGKALVFNFDSLFFISCKLDVCLIEPRVIIPPPSLGNIYITSATGARSHEGDLKEKKYCTHLTILVVSDGSSGQDITLHDFLPIPGRVFILLPIPSAIHKPRPASVRPSLRI